MVLFAKVQKDENLKSSAEMIRNMEKRIFAMDRRIETLVKLCDRLQQEKNGPCDTDTSGATSTDIEKNKYFAQLIQVSLLLSSVTGNDNYDMSLLDTDGEVVESLLTQAGQVKELSDQLENDLRLLLNSITSFLRLNDEKMDIKSCTGNRDEIIRSIQSKLGALSHKYSKSHEQGVELIQWKKKCSILQERECTTFEEINRLENQLKVFQNSTQDEQNAQVDKILAQLEDAEKRNKALKNSEREYITKIEEYERGYLDLLAEMEELKQKNLMEEDALLSKATLDAKSMEQQHIYDLESKLTNCEADRQVAIQDANRLQKEVDNLENVLEQFQKEKKIQRDMISSLQDQLSQIKQAKIDAMNEIDKLKQKDDEVSKTAYEAIETELIKKSNECERLREVCEFYCIYGFYLSTSVRFF
jgi:DNA repair exonuclease SbcCD ATPase subunit